MSETENPEEYRLLRVTLIAGMFAVSVFAAAVAWSYLQAILQDSWKPIYWFTLFRDSGRPNEQYGVLGMFLLQGMFVFVSVYGFYLFFRAVRRLRK